MVEAAEGREAPWWRRGVVYETYVRSFQDGNNDGGGDLDGIIRRLDYLAGSSDSLGVDAIWLTSFDPSPMADFGYDVADYTDVHPLFGDLAAFDRLVSEAHRRGLKVIVDFVPNHTSDRHPWFLASRSSRPASTTTTTSFPPSRTSTGAIGTSRRRCTTRSASGCGGRDGLRVDAIQVAVEPWLPLASTEPSATVAGKRWDPDSVFSLYRRLLAFRRTSAALSIGDYRSLPAQPPECLVFERRAGNQRALVVVNTGTEPAAIALPASGRVAVATNRSCEGETVARTLPLAADEAVVIEVAGG